MNESFTILTPTGDRPETFELCIKYVLRQTIQPTQWIVIDDGKNPMVKLDLPFVDFVRREQVRGEPKHTISVQMIKALDYVKYDKIIMMEDDDWYAPNYCEKMLELFNHHCHPGCPDLVGQGQGIYYHPRLKKYFIHSNNQHCSWCQTGFRQNLVPAIKRICQQQMYRSPYVDLVVWKLNIPKYILLNAPPLCIGMKGLPGRLGAVPSHNGRVGNFEYDLNWIKLAEWIGIDVELYKKYDER